jgi:hypothetical protein
MGGCHLEPESPQFFQEQTGILDELKLKEHILAVQEQANKVCHRGGGA